MLKYLHVIYLAGLHTWHTTRNWRDGAELAALAVLTLSRMHNVNQHRLSFGQARAKGRRMCAARRAMRAA